jgi:surfactin family lipopeptide synthetase A
MPSIHVTDQTGHPECVSSRLASCQGDRLAGSSELPPCLADLLAATARNHPDHGIHYLDSAGVGTFQSYARLLEDASRVLRGLRSLGLERGDMAIFQFERSADFLTAFWACALGGIIPVPLSIPPAYDQPNSALRKMHGCC